MFMLAKIMSANEFVRAARDGNITKVCEAIEDGQDINVKENGNTALMRASRYGHTDVVRELLSGGATVNLTNDNGNTALMRASLYGHTDVVRELLSGGATVDLTNIYGNTALMEVSFFGHTDTVRELLSGGATVDLTNIDGETALMKARSSRISNSEIISLLEEAERNVSATRHQIIQDSLVPAQTETTPDEELKEPFSQTVKHSSPPRYPLIQAPSFPEVIFFSEPQEKVLSQQGAHAKFDNGVEVSVSPHALPPKSTASVTVHPGFAPKDVFVMPQDVHSASPAYLIGMSGSEVTGEVTITIQHHVNIKTQEEADNLCFLQADVTPTRSGSYKYTQPPDSKSEFKPRENKGTLTTRRFSKKFFKVGLKKIKKWFKGVLNEPTEPSSPSPDPHLYTVRMYRSPPQTTGDRIAVIGISLYGQLYSKFLDDLPGLYPEVSSKAVDRTDSDPVGFEKLHAELEILSVQGWKIEPDKLTISKRGVDLAEMNNFKLDELQIDNYPPRIVCRFYPDGRPPKQTTCTLSITGFDDEVKVHVPLEAPKTATVDTTKLQEAAVKLQSTAVSVKETELVSTVATILTLMDSITTALLSSSLTDLAAQTDSIKKEVKTVLTVSRKVTEECSIPTIKDNLEVSLSKINVLSHQLCQVAKVKLNYCQDLLEETTALSDLVTNAAGLMTAIDTLLKDITFINTTPAYSALKVCGEMVVEGLSHEPEAIALSLFSAEFISEHTLHETIELNQIKRKKGTRLYEAVLGTVKSHPHKYRQFTAILRKDELLHKDLLLALEMAYK